MFVYFFKKTENMHYNIPKVQNHGHSWSQSWHLSTIYACLADYCGAGYIHIYYE